MPDTMLRADGRRVLADLNSLRAIGSYKTGVHKPTFSEPHRLSLDWLVRKLTDAGLSASIDGIGNVFGASTKARPKLLAGSHLESQNYAGWLDGPLGVVYALEAARVLNADPSLKGAVEVFAARLVFHQQHDGPEQIDKALRGAELFDVQLKGGHTLVGDAEDFEKINPEGLGL